MDNRAYWVGFNLIKGIGAVRIRALLNFFNDLSIAWQAPVDALISAGLSPKLADAVLQKRDQIDLEKVWEWIEKKGIQVLTWDDNRFPRLLKEIDQPPPLLYSLGSLTENDEWAVAIVGTRRMTAYGRQVTEELATYLAQNGITVISGLARGVDGTAHEAALKAGGRTIAILGCGVDTIYPPEHRTLAQQIINQGALLSDYAPGTPPDSSNFPPRNRIISGISIATVVVEAGEKSGALITATFAAEQGREVFAVPGYIHSPQSKGTNALIQQGAHPLVHIEDVLEALQIEQAHNFQQARLSLPVDDMEKKLIDTIHDEALHVDEICARTHIPIEKVIAALVMMELKGMVRQESGMSYIAVHEERGNYICD